MDFAMVSCPKGAWRSRDAVDEATRALASPTAPLCYPFFVVPQAETVLVNGRRYLRAPIPVHFPIEETVPEGGVHFELCTALFLILRSELAGRAFVGSDQFLYWNPTNPKECLAPDVMVRLGAPDAPVPCWKVWEGGAPHVAVEIISPTDSGDRNWSTKLERYRRSGVKEVVRFDPDDTDRPLRLWDSIDDDLVERDLADPNGRLSDVLGLYWCVVPDARLGRMLRLARDPGGANPIMTPDERERAALTRVAELEAELRRR
jgi:Uma2 family endonuclease